MQRLSLLFCVNKLWLSVLSKSGGAEGDPELCGSSGRRIVLTENQRIHLFSFGTGFYILLTQWTARHVWSGRHKVWASSETSVDAASRVAHGHHLVLQKRVKCSSSRLGKTPDQTGACDHIYQTSSGSPSCQSDYTQSLGLQCYSFESALQQRAPK